MLSLGPSRVDHIPAFRIATGLAIPLLVLLMTGRVEWAMFVGFGAFTGIYSRYEPTRLRFRRQVLAGAMLTLCVTLGATLAWLGEHLGPTHEAWTALLVGAVVAGLAATFVLFHGLKPAGAIFPLFAFAAVGAAPPAAPIWVALLGADRRDRPALRPWPYAPGRARPAPRDRHLPRRGRHGVPALLPQ